MINWIQLHLTLNHIPIIGGLFSVPLLLLGLFSKNDGIKRLSLFFCFVCSVAALPAYFSGESSEYLAGAISAIEDNKLVEHHEAAKVSTSLALVLTFISGLSLLFFRRLEKYLKIVFAVNLLLALFMTASMSYTGHLGGLLRHPELEHPPTPLPEGQGHHHPDGNKEEHSEKQEHDNNADTRSDHKH